MSTAQTGATTPARPQRDRRRLFALLVAVAIPMLMAVGFGGLFWARAVRTVGRVDSPQGTWTATVRVISIGGSAGYSTHVTVSSSRSWWPSRHSKVFVADSNNGAVPLGSTGEIPISVRWESNEQLVISYPAAARVYRQERQMGSVKITYEVQ